jgi:hypothetical protein
MVDVGLILPRKSILSEIYRSKYRGDIAEYKDARCKD